MSEYIDRKKLLEQIKLLASKSSIGETSPDSITGVEVIGLIIDNHAIDAALVRHGKIIETIEDGRMKRVFSCCGTDFTQMTCWMTPKYCPNCGARMDLEE